MYQSLAYMMMWWDQQEGRGRMDITVYTAGVALSSWVMWVTFIILSSESGITGWTQRVGLASVVSPEHCSKSTTWSVTSVAAAAENLNVMFLLWLKLSATHILLPQQSNLNVIERKFKRQILKPDPIILAPVPYDNNCIGVPISCLLAMGYGVNARLAWCLNSV